MGEEDEAIWTHGWVECDVCGHRHMSVHATTSERLECPKCGYMTLNPDHCDTREPTDG